MDRRNRIFKLDAHSKRREYTEKFIHQQHIRDAVNKPRIITRKFFYPFIPSFVQALPYTYRNVDAKEGTTIKISVTTDVVEIGLS